MHSDYPLKGMKAEEANNDTLCLFSRCSLKKTKNGDSQATGCRLKFKAVIHGVIPARLPCNDPNPSVQELLLCKDANLFPQGQGVCIGCSTTGRREGNSEPRRLTAPWQPSMAVISEENVLLIPWRDIEKQVEKEREREREENGGVIKKDRDMYSSLCLKV